MDRSVKKYSLNSKQVHILKLIYKFRFVNSSLLSRYKKLSRADVMNNRLKTLLEYKFIERRYHRSYRLAGIGATYCLTLDGLRLLRGKPGINTRVLHAMYNNDLLSPKFVDHSLDVFRAYLAIRDAYPDNFHIFTKSDLVDFDYFPEFRPDLYLNRINSTPDGPNQFILYIFLGEELFVIKKRLAALIEHFEEGEWEAESETPYPVIQMACPDARSEQRFREHALKTLDGAGIDDLKVYTTSYKALMGLQSPEQPIWTDVYDTEKLLTINEIKEKKEQ